MSYLHSNNVIHRDLNPKNVFLDDNLYPKLGDFGLSIRNHNVESMTYQSTSGMKGTPVYSSPEILKFNDYSKSGDVYAFSMIVYEIVTKKIPFEELKNTNDIYNEVVTKNGRPVIDESVPNCYRKLIEICWSENKNERPRFDDIVHILRTEKEFITKNINEEEFVNYIKKVDENKSIIETNNKSSIAQLDDLIETKSRIKETIEDDQSINKEDEPMKIDETKS